MNDHLRNAMLAARITPTDVAAALTVDPKTVHRWLQGRIPYPRHRWAIADLLQVHEADLWPQVAQQHLALAGDVRAIYPHRWAVPQSVWHALFQGATEEIDILTYSGLFLPEDGKILDTLTARAHTGVKIRILLGDPNSPQVARRGTDEGIGPEVMAARIKNALTLYRRLHDVPNVEIRLHRTVLYNSIFRADNELLVNLHAYATPAANAPVMHLHHKEEQGAAAVYLTSFVHIWTAAAPHHDEI
ncbi:XRE family transcriptional regulator [Nonomuraea spiralis]|uniref:XRE family transcriptional regulator n=1 Tax=Nonomuraea spiralis TaxID=46182 RepID=A0ABV5IQP6_9ACTN|nr:XRE family transcriptional regulator [Nonomuraea spiralis]GGT47246.1 transcriptional regulator [Nonomuraea spiralis]